MNRSFASRKSYPVLAAAVALLAVAALLVTCSGDDNLDTPTPTAAAVNTPPIDNPDPTTPPVGQLGVALPHPEFFPEVRLCGDNPPLEPLQFGDITPDLELPNVFVRRAAYHNELDSGQDWQFVVRSGSAEALRLFTADNALKVCLEAALGPLADLVGLTKQTTSPLYPLSLILMSEIAAQTGASVDELSQHVETPRVIIEAQGVAPVVVVEAVIENVNAQPFETLSKVSPDWLAAFEADSVAAVNDLLDMPGLLLGVGPAENRPLGRTLAEEPNAMAIEILPAGNLAEEFLKQGGVIYYVVDPSVGPSAPNFFVAHCSTYAYARATLNSMVNNGSLTLSLTKVGTASTLSTVSIVTASTSKLEYSSSKQVTFDIGVSATQSATYTIDGNWVVGNGGVCAGQ